MSSIIIPLKGLGSEAQHFDFKADKAFIEAFEADLLLDCNCSVSVDAARRGSSIAINCAVEGTASVECDRCLERLDVPVDVKEQLSVRFSSESDAEDENDNVITLPEGETECDLSQCVYDFICLSIPLQKVHEDGGCNPEMLARICTEPAASASEGNSPFSGLKDILNDNNNN